MSDFSIEALVFSRSLQSHDSYLMYEICNVFAEFFAEISIFRLYKNIWDYFAAITYNNLVSLEYSGKISG